MHPGSSGRLRLLCGHRKAIRLEPERHKHVPVLVSLVLHRLKLHGALFIFQAHPDTGSALDGLEEIQKVLIVESDPDGLEIVACVENLCRLAIVAAGGCNLQSVFVEEQRHGTGLLARQERDAFHCSADLICVLQEFGVLTRQRRLVIRKSPAERPRYEQTISGREEKVPVIARDLHRCTLASFTHEPRKFPERPSWDEQTQFSGESDDRFRTLDQRQPVPVRGHHSDSVGLHQQQSSV